MFKKKAKDTKFNNMEQTNEFSSKKINRMLDCQKGLKDLIAPAGIDASNPEHLEIVSRSSRFARNFYVAGIPRMATFSTFLRALYSFGDINTSVHITPIDEGAAQRRLNKEIDDLESERIISNKRGDINRLSELNALQAETQQLRDEIVAGFNKLYEATIVCTIFSETVEELNKLTDLLKMEMAKGLIVMRMSWAIQEKGFKTNLPYCNDLIKKAQLFDKKSMGTVFPFVISDISHEKGIPIGFNAQTGVPVLFDNFSNTLSNYNLIIFGKSGAGKGVTIKTFVSRSSVLMGIESIALDAEGEYGVVAEALGGINIVISPNSTMIVNPFDIEVELVKDEITGRQTEMLSVENKVEDVTNILLTMARGSTKSDTVNELTKQIIAESVYEEYEVFGINNSPESLFTKEGKRKNFPTIGSWYKRMCQRAKENTNVDYQYHYSYLVKVMKQYVKSLSGQLAYFDGQSTFNLSEDYPFINFDISRLEEKFVRPLAQQILLSWIWEKYVKKNSEDKTKARKRRVIVDEAWMLLPYPEAVDFLNTMARRARKRNVSLAVVSQKFQDFYENKNVQAVLTTSEVKLFLQQDKSEVEYMQEVFKLSDGEASFLGTCNRGEGILKVGNNTTIISIVPTKKELQFVETNVNKIANMTNNQEM